MEDLEEYTGKIKNSFYEQTENQSRENNLWNLLDNLTRELDINKEREEELEKSLKLCLTDDNSNINSKYVTLKEKCKQLEKDNEELHTQLENSKNRLTMELETEKAEFERRISNMEELYKREINDLKNQLENDNKFFEEKEQKLYNELQLAQASTALQCDELEAKLTRQLIDANCKLRQSQSFIRSLQMEINNLKNQIATQPTPPIHRFSKPENLKYAPLPLSTPSASGDETEEFESREFQQARGGTHMVFKGINTPRKKNHVPPLKQCSSAISSPAPSSSGNKVKGVSRKRKLYNPDDMEYLQELQENE